MDVLREAVAESTEIQEKLWQHAMRLGKEYPRAVTVGLFIGSLNAFSATMVGGVHAGLSGGRSWLATVLLAITPSMVLMLIIDIDRPGQTLFGVSQQSLIDLRQSMDAPRGGTTISASNSKFS